jgi:hypothetical protein
VKDNFEGRSKKKFKNPLSNRRLSNYHLRSSKKDPTAETKVLEGGLALDQESPTTVGRKYFISKAKSEAMKEEREGKQLTICGALRAGKPQKMVAK